jgi:hypothetical protein
VIGHILIGQIHLNVKVLFNRDSAFQKCFQKILHSLQGRKIGSLLAVRTTCHPVRTPSCPKLQPSGRRVIPSGCQSHQSIIRSGDVDFSSGPSSVLRSFELLQLASIWMFQQSVRTTLNVRSSFRISFQTQIWEDYCNHPDDMDFCPDALLLKVSSQFKFNRPDASLPWSVHA